MQMLNIARDDNLYILYEKSCNAVQVSRSEIAHD